MKHIKILSFIAAVAGTLHLTACSPGGGRDDGHVQSGQEHENGDSKTETAAHARNNGTKLKPYPLDVCLVSGEKLGSMGEPPVIEHEGQQIKFCCGGCEDDFKADPEKFLTKMNEAVADNARQ